MKDDSNPENKSLRSTLDKNPLLSAPVHPHYISLTSEEKDSELSGVKLEFKDYIALFIALLETVFLPFLILMGVFFLLSFVFYNV